MIQWITKRMFFIRIEKKQNSNDNRNILIDEYVYEFYEIFCRHDDKVIDSINL